MRKHFGVLVSVGCLIAGWSLWAEDWPQWRGPNRDGQIRISEPKTWPEKLTTKWKITVGEGYASPLVAGGRILQFARQGDEEVTRCLDPKDGKELWSDKYAAAGATGPAAQHAGPRSSPTVAGGKVVTLGVPTSTAGCVPISYALRQPRGALANV